MAASYPEATDVIIASSHAHEEERGMSRAMAGMVLFIASEVMLFGGLFAAYFFVRNQATEWPPEGVEHTVAAGLGGVLTAILVLSGFVGHFGIVAARRNNQPLFLLCLAGAIALGTIFIIGQSYEWLELMDEGLTISSTVYGSTFYIMTGFHGAHVIVGLLMLVVVFVRAYWRDFTPARHVYADAAMLYWHFVDIVWVGLYILLYLA